MISNKYELYRTIKTQRGVDAIKIHARFFGLISASLGFSEKYIEIAEGTTVRELLDMINIPVNPSWIVVNVNGVVKDKNTVLNDCDELLILPVGGGG